MDQAAGVRELHFSGSRAQSLRARHRRDALDGSDAPLARALAVSDERALRSDARDRKRRCFTRASASRRCLHDIGTFPFSHAIENAYIRHGNDTRRLERREGSSQLARAPGLVHHQEHRLRRRAHADPRELRLRRADDLEDHQGRLPYPDRQPAHAFGSGRRSHGLSPARCALHRHQVRPVRPRLHPGEPRDLRRGRGPDRVRRPRERASTRSRIS